MEAGFLAEVERLAARPEGLSRTARQALGYRELLAHLAGEASLDEALDLAVRRTRQFARRQRSWFRRDPRIRWLPAEDDPLRVLPDLLRDWYRCA
jgi:tRNA dimethylallyltransferase